MTTGKARTVGGDKRSSPTSVERSGLHRFSERPTFRAVDEFSSQTAGEFPVAAAARLLGGLVGIWKSDSVRRVPPGRTTPSAGLDVNDGDLQHLISLGLIRNVPHRNEPASEIGKYTLTPAGETVVRQASVTLASVLQRRIARPHWDRFQHELRLGRVIVKRFRRPAPNQELILAAFEEQDWPERIDDPLPVSLEVDPRQRLHETIKSLNQCVASAALQFGGDGTGLGVRWRLRAG